MAIPAVTFTFTNGTSSDAGQVNTNFADLIAGMTDGTKDFSISALTLAGAFTANGACTFGNATSDDLTFTGSLASSIPIKTTATYNIGSSTIGMLSQYFGRNNFTTRLIGSAAMAASYTFTLPPNVGTTGHALVDSDGAATTAWQPLHGPDSQINLSISASVAASALTVALKDAGGSDASATSPIRIAFRSATAATGSYAIRTVSAALSVVVSSGSTLGHTNSVAEYIYVYAIDNAGTVELAVSSKLFDDGSIVSTTTEGGGGAADSFSVMYSTTARSNVGCRLIGRLLSTQATAGTWATAMSEVSSGQFRPAVTSMIRADTGNGHGSTNTKIRRLTNATTVGSAITRASSASDGDSYTINQAGVYAISYSEAHSSVAAMGISLNSAQLTTNIATITTANRLIAAENTANVLQNVSVTAKLAVGDVIRPHTDGATGNTSALIQFVITQLAQV